ncbi:hypothetical protein [Algibacter sp. L1A34]|uniref:hypothetical protein n=1 Tax=Algibacter sp. L1A34 TaxID=2686365 RepID=UPI0018EF12EC|nr:hypothetical protein [Algibacter sp. L1A34]
MYCSNLAFVKKHELIFTSIKSEQAEKRQKKEVGKIKTPKTVPKCLLYAVAGLMEFSSKITGKEPLLQRHYLDMFYGLKQDYDISASKSVLGFNPKPSKQALEEALKCLKNAVNFIRKKHT